MHGKLCNIILSCAYRIYVIIIFNRNIIYSWMSFSPPKKSAGLAYTSPSHATWGKLHIPRSPVNAVATTYRAVTATTRYVIITVDGNVLFHNFQVKRYSYSTSNESASSGQQLWSLERSCSGKCEDGCIVIGERIKIYACQACCETPLCNVSNGSGRSALPSVVVCLSFVFLLSMTVAVYPMPKL